MNRIKKFIIPLLIFVFSSLASYAQNDCIVALLANDLSSSTAEFKTTVKQSEGFMAWQLLNKEKPTLRTNIEELNQVSKNLEAIKSVGGYMKWKALQGTGSLLNAEEKFIDNLLETDYAKYLTRKATQGKTPRGRLDWKEARDYWLFDSPMARGNAFNKKAVDNVWYDFNEVTLANGKRVDGYTPPTNSKAGEIVSRKATNLEEIELSTFEGYLKEMKTKYPVGEAINAPKYGNDLKGKVLEGNQILEIPASNQSFSQIQDYIDLAKNKYNIEIRFKPE
jgi:hypothetical protein